MKTRLSVLISSLVVLTILSLTISSAAVSTGEFTVGNEPPTLSNLQVQDSATHWDNYDISGILDTHDITPNFRWNMADPNPDTLRTKVCISSAPGLCDIVNDTNLSVIDTYTIASGLTWPACGSSKIYYIDLTPNDGQIDGAVYSATFQILNSVPVISGFAMAPSVTATTTHSQTPTFSWTSTDADDGSENHWPADVITDSVYVGDTCGSGLYLNKPTGANPTGEIASTIPWGAIIGTVSTKNFCTRLVSSDSVCTTTSDNTLQLIDNIPDPALLVAGENIFLSDSAITASDSCIDFLPQNCTIAPLAGTYTSVNIEARVQDIDADCSAITHSAQVTLKYPGKDYVYSLTYSRMVGDICYFTASIPSDDPAGIEFFRNPGGYNLELIVISQGGSLPAATHTWEYLSLVDIDYPALIYLGDKVQDGGNGIQLGQWNPGLSLAAMTNWGNRALTLLWEATDPQLTTTTPKLVGCSGHNATCWDLTTKDDFQVDDDTIQGETTETVLIPSNIPETPANVIFEPTGGLSICNIMTCVTPTTANLNTYFHIAPPIGLQTGTYQTALTITTNAI